MEQQSITSDQYFAAPGVSNSMLGEFKRSPAHLKAYLAGKEKTKAMEIGSDFHDLLLMETAPKVAIKPDGMSFATRDGKAWRAEREAAGLRIYTQDEYDSIYGMRESIMRVPILRFAIENGIPERALFAKFTLGGTVMRKGKLDLIHELAPTVLDFKTTTDARRQEFSSTIGERGYLRQAAYYTDLAEANDLGDRMFVFVAVEKFKPYAVGIYYMTEDQIEAGRKQYVRLLQRYMECEASGEWPAYPLEPMAADVPEWALKAA